VNQNDGDYLVKTTASLALCQRCGLLSNYFDLFFCTMAHWIFVGDSAAALGISIFLLHSAIRASASTACQSC